MYESKAAFVSIETFPSLWPLKELATVCKFHHTVSQDFQV